MVENPPLRLPEGTTLMHNPSDAELEEVAGFPEDSEILERHGRHFHLLEGSSRIVLELIHFVEGREGLAGRPQMKEERTVYLLPEGTTLLEARKIGYDLLEERTARGSAIDVGRATRLTQGPSGGSAEWHGLP